MRVCESKDAEKTGGVKVSLAGRRLAFDPVPGDAIASSSMSWAPCPFEKLRPSQLNRDDAFYMSLAFNLAVDAWHANEVPIGAVIIAGGEVIGAAHNEIKRTGDPTAHAEVLAITQAASKIGDWRLNACTLYVTKEPCPMCAGASIMSRVGRVVWGCHDPKMGCMGGAFPLQDLKGLVHRVATQGGILEPPCREILQAYFSLKREDSAAGGLTPPADPLT